MTFPRFQLRTDEDVPPEVLERRRRFAAGPLANRTDAAATTVSFGTPEAMAEAFGRDMFRRCGKDWPRMIGIASGAAMKAERDNEGGER